MEKRTFATIILPLAILFLWLMVSPTLACPYDGSKCKDCIVKQMKCACPSCGPVLRCMARCLWGGSSTTDCVNSCNCGANGNPKLSDCKKCMSRCKCSCLVY